MKEEFNPNHEEKPSSHEFDWVSKSDEEFLELLDKRLYFEVKAAEIDDELTQQAIESLHLTENQMKYLGLLQMLYISGIQSKDEVVEQSVERIKELEFNGETKTGEYIATKAFLILVAASER